MIEDDHAVWDEVIGLCFVVLSVVVIVTVWWWFQ